MIPSAIPAIVAVVTAVWASLLARVSRRFKAAPDPIFPFAQNQGLALELCASASEANAILGKSGTDIGDENRRVAASVQKLDFVFILLYVAFFIATALVLAPWPACWPAVASAVVTGIFDYWEDFRILGALRPNTNFRPPKPIGQMKWLFYFLTLGIEGVLLFQYGVGKGGKGAMGMAFAALPVVTAIWGFYSSIRGSFKGILSGSRLSALGLLLLAAAPPILHAPFL